LSCASRVGSQTRPRLRRTVGARKVRSLRRVAEANRRRGVETDRRCVMAEAEPRRRKL